MPPINDLQLESIYRRVEARELNQTEPQSHPKAVLLGGQGGSGKSALAQEAMHEMSARGGAIIIDADRMRELNPRFRELSKSNPESAADLTHREAAEWSRRLTVTAQENHRNLVVDGTMRNPESIAMLTKSLRENGYEVEARVAAVRPELSMLRAQARYEDQVITNGAGRQVSSEQHSQAVEGVVRTVARLEREALVDKITVVNSRQEPIYINELNQGQWRDPVRGAQAVTQERERPLTLSDRQEMLEIAQRTDRLHYERTGSVNPVYSQQVTKLSTEIREVAPAQEYAIRDQRGTDLRTRSPSEAAKEFVNIPAESYPRVVAMTGYGARAVAETQDNARQLEPTKLVVSKSDPEFRQAFERMDRAQAFYSQSTQEVLKTHPELDWAVKQMEGVRRQVMNAPDQNQRESEYLSAKIRITEQIEKGYSGPSNAVTKQESSSVISYTAEHRGLIVRDAAPSARDTQGTVVATTSHHALVQVSDMVAIRFDKSTLSQSVDNGDRVTIQHGETNHVMKQDRDSRQPESTSNSLQQNSIQGRNLVMERER